VTCVHCQSTKAATNSRSRKESVHKTHNSNFHVNAYFHKFLPFTYFGQRTAKETLQQQFAHYAFLVKTRPVRTSAEHLFWSNVHFPDKRYNLL